MIYKTPQNRIIETIKIVTIYALFGFIWIYGSDTALGWLVHDQAMMAQLSVVKGFFFILCTTILLFFLINRFAKQLTTAERRQIESLKNYQAIFNATNEAIFIHDAQDGHIVDVNDRMLEIFGYERDEALAVDIGSMSMGTAPYSQIEAAEKVRQAQTEGPQVFEWHTRRKSGELFWSEVSLKRVTIIDYDRIIAVVRDITERKQVEEVIRESEKKWRAVFERSPVGIALMNNQTVMLECNQHLADIFGVEREKYIGINLLQSIPEGPIWQNLTDAQADNESHNYEGAYTSILSGKHLYINITSEKVAPDLIISIIVDITEQMETALAHEKLQAQLHQAQKMESVALLAGGVAHDFNNMLGVILGHTEMAKDKIDPNLPIFSDLEKIHNAAERSTNLTRQLLTFARKQNVAPKVLDLNETVEGMLTMLRRLIGENINLLWMPGPGLWPVKMDPTQLDQILANLSVNARDAIAGVGKIIVTTENSTIDTDYCTLHAGIVPGQYVRISLNDNGCGMNKETLTHIFEPFFTTKGIGEGTGLGLASVYGAVKQNRGFINVYSEPDQGTTFSIYLPRYTGDSLTQALEEVETTIGGNETILVVEDELTLLEMTSLMLRNLGYTVFEASTSVDANHIAKANDCKIDLLLTDVIMPEMNGKDLAGRLLKYQSGMKCLFMSGYTANIIATQGVIGESVNFIQKPFSKKDLAKKVRDALGN